jgi:hypothetical protein
VPIALDFARPFNNRIEVVDAKSMKITSLTLHFFEPVPLALIFFLKKKKNPQPVVSYYHWGLVPLGLRPNQCGPSEITTSISSAVDAL